MVLMLRITLSSFLPRSGWPRWGRGSRSRTGWARRLLESYQIDNMHISSFYWRLFFLVIKMRKSLIKEIHAAFVFPFMPFEEMIIKKKQLLAIVWNPKLPFAKTTSECDVLLSQSLRRRGHLGYNKTGHHIRNTHGKDINIFTLSSSVY